MKNHILLVLLALALIMAGCSTTSDQSRPETKPSEADTITIKTNYVTVTNISTNASNETVTNYETVTHYVIRPVRTEDMQTRYGLSLHDAQDKALNLSPGMTQNEIISLLGKPDETSAGTYGTQTPKPWNGIAWYYRWETVNSYPAKYKVLSIVFEKGVDAWVVNMWQWGGL